MPALLPLSAQSPEALEAYARSFRDALVRDPDIAPADLLTTTALGRRHLSPPAGRHRARRSRPSARPRLDAFRRWLGRQPCRQPCRRARPRPRRLPRGSAEPRASAARTARGPWTLRPRPRPDLGRRVRLQRAGRRPARHGRGARRPVPRGGRRPGAVRPCPSRRRPGSGTSSTGSSAGRGPERWDTDFAQPAIFAFQVAQAMLWRRFGVSPVAVAGHSAGEFAALCVAGALSVADGMRLDVPQGPAHAGHRTRRDARRVRSAGARTPTPRRHRPSPRHGRLELAVSNGPAQPCGRGPPAAAVEAARAWLAEHGVAGEPLPVDRAFHTELLDPVLDELRAGRGEGANCARCRWSSSADSTGRCVRRGWLPDADYLVRQARHTGGLPRGVAHARAERRPGRAGARARRSPAWPAGRCRAPSAYRPRAAAPARTACGRRWPRLHCAGVGIDWAALLDGCGGRRIPLPMYPFQHRSYWTGPPPHPGPAADPAPATEGSMEVGMTEQAVLERVLELTAQHLGYRADELGAGDDVRRSRCGLAPTHRDTAAVGGRVRSAGLRPGAPRRGGHAGADRPSDRLAGGPGRAGGRGGDTASQRPRCRSAALRPSCAPRLLQPRPPRPPRPPPEYASRAEIAELTRQVNLLAETQAAMLTQLSEAVALLTAERAR